jgi:hypothetical protein
MLLLINNLSITYLINKGKDMNTTTQVDTIGLKLEFNNSAMQRDVSRRLIQYIESISKRLRVIYKERFNAENRMTVDCLVILDGRIVIAKIITGANSNKIGTISYYLNLVIAGLKSYDEDIDDVKFEFLLTISSWYNDKRLNFTIRQLDCDIDVSCPFDNLHVMQYKWQSKNSYKVKEEQKYHTTKYLQKKRKYKPITLGLSYDKQIKEDLDSVISRFELKLLLDKNNNKNSVNIYNKLLNSFGRYAVYCFKDLNLKDQFIYNQNLIENSSAESSQKQRMYHKLIKHFLHSQVNPDIDYILNYINMLYTVRRYKMILNK